MSIFASILRSVYKLSGAKKAFALPEDEITKVIERQNRHRGVFTPTDRKEDFAKIVDILKNEIGNGRVMIESRRKNHGTKRSHSRCVPNDGRQ